jgi:hypothetical protein
MVQLASFLVADSVASYCSDHIDEGTIQAVFDPPELDEGLARRQSLPPDLTALLRGWARGSPRSTHHGRRHGGRGDRQARAGRLLIDCTGSKSLLRDRLVPGSAAEDGEG